MSWGLGCLIANTQEIYQHWSYHSKQFSQLSFEMKTSLIGCHGQSQYNNQTQMTSATTKIAIINSNHVTSTHHLIGYHKKTIFDNFFMTEMSANDINSTILLNKPCWK